MKIQFSKNSFTDQLLNQISFQGNDSFGDLINASQRTGEEKNEASLKSKIDFSNKKQLVITVKSGALNRAFSCGFISGLTTEEKAKVRRILGKKLIGAYDKKNTITEEKDPKNQDKEAFIFTVPISGGLFDGYDFSKPSNKFLLSVKKKLLSVLSGNKTKEVDTKKVGTGSIHLKDGEIWLVLNDKQALSLFKASLTKLSIKEAAGLDTRINQAIVKNHLENQKQPNTRSV